MKRLILKILLFLLPVAALALFLEHSQRNAPSELRYKARFMKRHAAELELVVLGPSYTHRIPLDSVGCRAFNLSYSNQPAERNYDLWKRYRKRMPRLKYVVYSLSYWFHENRANGLEAWRTPFYTIHYGLPVEGLSLDKRFIVANPKIATKIKWGELFTRHDADAHPFCDSLGANPANERNPDWATKSAAFMARRHADIDPENARINRAMLEKVIAECEEDGVKVLLVTPPTWHTYYDLLPRQVVEMTESLGREMEALHLNVTYLNLKGDPRFTDEDFTDCTHLNYNHGGRKMEEILRAYVTAGGSITEKEPTNAINSADIY